MHSVTDRTEGTLLRGAAGNLYFIPEDSLKQFQVPDVEIEWTEKMIGEGGAPGWQFSEAGLSPVAEVHGPPPGSEFQCFVCLESRELE